MMVRDRWLLVGGLVLVVAALAGMGFQAPGAWWGGDGGWGMHRGPMMGWWASDTDTDTESEPEIPDAPSIRVEATDFAFRPARLELTAGEPVNVELSNTGAVIHDFSIPELGFQLVAGPGEAARGGLEVDDPGEYRFLCTVPGHAGAGMVGVLVVDAP